jgi:hypothetical protein
MPRYEAWQVGAAMQGFASDLGASAGQIQDVQDRPAVKRTVARRPQFVSV